MRSLAFIFAALFGCSVNGGVVVDLVNNVCHVPLSETNERNEYHVKGCDAVIRIDENGKAWAYAWVERENVPKFGAPVYPEAPSGTQQVNVTGHTTGFFCDILSEDHDGSPMKWVSANWHSSVKVDRTMNQSWVAVRYSIYCYAGRPE